MTAETSLERNCWHHDIVEGGVISRMNETDLGYICQRCGKRWSLSGYAVDPKIEILVKPDDSVLPHSRACGIRHHAHGLECSRDCPTCGGKVLKD